MVSNRTAPARAHNGLVVVLPLMAVAALIAMHLYTGQVWEDFFITYRHSENAVPGYAYLLSDACFIVYQRRRTPAAEHE